MLTALNRAIATKQLVYSHRVAGKLAEYAPDLIIAPLQGGVAQACLMARACGEAFRRTRIALWANETSRSRLLRGDVPITDLSPIIADAMERESLSLADAVILPSADAVSPLLPGLKSHPATVICHPINCRTALPPPARIREIVFLGALQRARGAGEFVEAMERLSRAGVLRDCLVTFLGPAADSAYSLSREWLGQKAAAWPFRFQVIAETDLAKSLAYARGKGRLTVGISPDGYELNSIRTWTKHHVVCIGRPMKDPSLPARLAASIAAALQGKSEVDTYYDVDWPKVIADMETLPLPEQQIMPSSKISVCILHYNRLSMLRQAIASIPYKVGTQEPEIIVIDNASPIDDIEGKIRQLAHDRLSLRVMALPEPLPQATAYNRGLATARGDVVVFLDDDNLFRPDGLLRLANALADRRHDIVVTALDVFDDNNGEPSASAGCLIFLGRAHSAGLFFNAFGDTAMAVHRETFTAHGGFHDLGYDYPSFDWVSLAKAQSAGLRIGALQRPAIRYRRNTVRADLQAIKLDEAGARALVFDAYQGRFDGELVGRFAQHLQLGEI